ncbi:MAG TPA: serine/threonine-protein kinase, partial [Planctomycetota bacterium]|nr:serine/threonine-protein kinase [Planctomycetota bacterium]
MKPESSMGEAERVFAEYRRRVESGETADLEALCARRPEIADDLRFLESICVVGDRAGRSFSFRQFLESRFGPGAVDRFALASDTGDVPGPGAPAAATIEPTVAGLRGDTPAGVPRGAFLAAGASGRYAIEEKVAEGGMGVIYRVFDRNLRRTLAMKVQKLPIRPAASPADSPSPKDDNYRFLEEAHITAQLDHPGIVPVHELGLSAENQTYFTMALVRGRSLKEILEAAREGREGWNRARAVGVIVKVCQAVAYAHNKGIVHRDLKPDNVMVGRFGEVYVLDWGLAKVRGEKDRHDLRPRLETGARAEAESTDAGGSPGATTSIGSDSSVVTMDGTVMGTPAFMPPEQAAGRLDEVDERSDVYALGAMLYQLLTGQVPYLEPGERIAPQILLLRVLDGPPRPVGEVVSSAPPELVAICDKAMARESSGRYRTGLELAEDLQAYLDHRVVRAYESGRWAELKKWCSRHRGALRAVAGVGLFLIAAATFVGWFLRVQQAEDLIASGREHLAEYRRLQGASAALHARWVETRQTVSWLPVWYRRQELETHARLEATRREIDELHSAATRDFSNARELAPILSGVRRVAVAQLGDVYGERYRDILDGEVFPEVPELYLERIRKLGLAASREDLDPHVRVRIGSVPPGADVYCFRHVASSESPLLPLPFDARTGEICGGPFLRIARIWAAERHQGIFAAGDRIVSVRGRAVSSRTELVAAVEDIAEDQAIDVVVRREREEKLLRWIPFPSGLRMSDATVRVPEIRLRFGFTLEGYPLDFVDRCLAGRTDEETPLSVALPRGSYLLVLRRPG